MVEITQALWDAGVGGFWIAPDGHIEPVRGLAEHTETLSRLIYTPMYSSAYNAGFIRVSLYSESSFDMNWDNDRVSLTALKTLNTLLRDPNMPGHVSHEFSFEIDHPGAGRRGYTVFNDYKSSTEGSADPLTMAKRHLMQFILEKNAAVKSDPSAAERDAARHNWRGQITERASMRSRAARRGWATRRDNAARSLLEALSLQPQG